MRIIIDLGRMPDDPGRRADIDHALRILAANQMIEWLEWDGERGRDTGPADLAGSLRSIS